MDKPNKSTKNMITQVSLTDPSLQIVVDDTELPNLLKQFITTQSNILDLKQQIKNQNIQYKILQQKIIQFMNLKQLQNINTPQNIISIRSTNIKQHINMSLLSNYFNKKHGIPMETLETFLEQLPTKTQNTLIIKPK